MDVPGQEVRARGCSTHQDARRRSPPLLATLTPALTPALTPTPTLLIARFIARQFSSWSALGGRPSERRSGGVSAEVPVLIARLFIVILSRDRSANR